MRRLLGLIWLIWLTVGGVADAQYLTAADLASFPSAPPPTETVSYGAGPLQFGELRLPAGPGPHPVAVVIHGGCWLSRFDIAHIGNLVAALTEMGVATWSLEYRRVGDDGGGWPGTFEDIARGADLLRVLGREYPLDLDRAIAIGHSAGGHFALWLAGRHGLSVYSPFYMTDPVELRGVLGLAAAPDLARVHASGACEGAMDVLIGGAPDDLPDRYAQTSPIEMLPLGVPQILISGAHDLPRRLETGDAYVAAARDRGDDVELIVAEESAHFEMIDPRSTTWPIVRGAVRTLLQLKP